MPFLPGNLRGKAYFDHTEPMNQPGDNLLERYALKSASEREMAMVEEHLLTCDECRSRLLETDRYLRVVREALKEAAPELISTHETSDGIVYLTVQQEAGGGQAALVLGPDAKAGAVKAATRGEAEQYCQRAFQEMCPEHCCTPRCRSDATRPC